MRERFSYTIKRAKSFIHACEHQCLFTRDKATGAIFSLKNNWGWVDRVEQVVESKEIVVDIEE